MMKILRFIVPGIIFGTLSIGVTSCGTAEEFANLRHEKDIDVMHIPRGVGFLANTAGVFFRDKAARSALTGFKSMDIISCERKGNRQKVYQAVAYAREKNRLELLIEAREGNETTYIYGYPDIKSNKVKDAMIVCEEPSDLTVVRMKGSFNLQSLFDDNTKSKKKKTRNKTEIQKLKTDN